MILDEKRIIFKANGSIDVGFEDIQINKNSNNFHKIVAMIPKSILGTTTSYVVKTNFFTNDDVSIYTTFASVDAASNADYLICTTPIRKAATANSGYIKMTQWVQEVSGTTYTTTYATDQFSLRVNDGNDEVIYDVADISVTDALASRIVVLENGDITLQTNINNEATARQNADTTLQTNIDNEASARASGDSTLQTNINTEASNRASGDTVLQANIDNETSARASADSTLTGAVATANSEIESLKARATTLENKVAKRVTAYTFDTEAQLLAWIVGTYTREDGLTKEDLKNGDDLLIVETQVCDYWWDEENQVIREREAEKYVGQTIEIIDLIEEVE